MLFAIGDIHGCAVELRLLLNKLPLDRNSTVVFVGDYVDRGPDSRGVIDTVLELAARCNVITLKGNHERMMLDFLEDPYSRAAGLFIYNGGSATLESYRNPNGVDCTVPARHVWFLKQLRMTYETDHDFFVHAGVPNIPLDKIDTSVHEDLMLWTRKPFLNSKYEWSKTIIHGHSPVDAVDVRRNRINIDTGCVYRQKLSALALPGNRVFSVDRQTEVTRVVLQDPRGSRAAARFTGELPIAIIKDGTSFDFRTLDYSELGMYIRSVLPNVDPGFAVGDEVAGEVAPGDVGSVEFKGHVVRVRKEAQGVFYAIQIE